MHTYRYDLHVHTTETSPCGNVAAAELVKLYQKTGYAGLVVTDHYYSGYFQRQRVLSWKKKIDNFLAGYRAAKQAGIKHDLQIFLGMEIRFNNSPNDYLVYGITEDFLYKNPELYNYGLARFREHTSKAGILIFQAHPFRNNMQTPQPELLDGIESFNGNQRHNSRNNQATCFAQKHQMQELSGSDFHEYEDLATGGVCLPRKANNYADFLDMLQNKKTLIGPNNSNC